MKRIITLFAFLIPLFIAHPAYADVGRIHGTYEYDGDLINGVEVGLYKIADYDNDSGEFVFGPGYDEVDIGRMTNSELGDYGQALAQIVGVPDAVTQTIEGEYGFAEMDEGIYLVTFKDITIGDYTYSALPIVLTMPDANYNYQIELTTKLEKSCPDCIEPEPDKPDEPDQANTRDTIRKYVTTLVICIILEALMLYVIIKEREKNQNEEK